MALFLLVLARLPVLFLRQRVIAQDGAAQPEQPAQPE
jgi:hypothetical protein